MTRRPGRSPAVGAGPVAMLAVLLALWGAALVEPALRGPLAGLGPLTAFALVVGGIRRFRPRGAVWPSLAAILACWAVAHLLVVGTGRVGTASAVLVVTGEVAAGALLVHIVRYGRGEAAPDPGAAVDVLLMVTVFGVVAAQLVAAVAQGGSGWPALVLATLDVTLVGLLLRLVVTRRALPTSTSLVLLAGIACLAYDIHNALQGTRMALPGQPAQVLGALCVLLFGVAAWHPSMVTALDRSAFARHRTGSGSLLGLLPLVLVPLASWWVAAVTGRPGLPAWVLLATGALVAALCLLRATTALRRSEHLAEHDPLTGLANRRGLARAVAADPPAGGRSLLLVDLDDFKQINDTYGHDTGDALLLAVRDRLLAAGTDRHVAARHVTARLGGDEFVVLVPTDDAVALAQDVLDRLRSPVEIGDLRLRTSASIGIAQGGPDDDLSELITHADVAMYAAKSAGRNGSAVYVPGMREEVVARFEFTSQVRQLLGARAPHAGRLEVHYQPVVELTTRRPVAAEALVRWRHPERGLLTPDAFLGVVRSTGLDVRLDDEVLTAVLAQLAAWRERGLDPLPVSVNLTADSLGDPTLADRVLAALADAGVPAPLLRLEITEHEGLADDAPAAWTLPVLAAAGVAVHLDDYGVGYTSLDYLRRFPVDVLKLDRSVTASMGADDVPLVDGVAALARTLDLELLAEGVETPEQHDQLLRRGVRYGQGWLYSRPLPAEAFGRLLLAIAGGHGALLPTAADGVVADGVVTDGVVTGGVPTAPEVADSVVAEGVGTIAP